MKVEKRITALLNTWSDRFSLLFAVVLLAGCSNAGAPPSEGSNLGTPESPVTSEQVLEVSIRLTVHRVAFWAILSSSQNARTRCPRCSRGGRSVASPSRPLSRVIKLVAARPRPAAASPLPLTEA